MTYSRFAQQLTNKPLAIIAVEDLNVFNIPKAYPEKIMQIDEMHIINYIFKQIPNPKEHSDNACFGACT